MDRFFDEAARILASEMPRRKALGRLGALVGGGLMAALGVAPAQAQSTTCTVGGKTITCNGNNKVCCTTGTQPFCVPPGKRCCGNDSCESNKPCCGTGTAASCGQPNTTCCGNTSCKNNETCCSNTVCCGSNTKCVSGKCVPSRS